MGATCPPFATKFYSKTAGRRWSYGREQQIKQETPLEGSRPLLRGSHLLQWMPSEPKTSGDKQRQIEPGRDTRKQIVNREGDRRRQETIQDTRTQQTNPAVLFVLRPKTEGPSVGFFPKTLVRPPWAIDGPGTPPALGGPWKRSKL